MMIEKYKPFESTQFKKGRKLAMKQGLDMSLLRWGIEQLSHDIPLPANWKDHRTCSTTPLVVEQVLQNTLYFAIFSGSCSEPEVSEQLYQLKGNLKRYRECHIGGSGDWLLVYEKRNTEMILYLVGTGTHGDLFGLE